MRARESWFLHEKQPPDIGKRYIEKKCLDVFGSKVFYSSNPQLWGCVVISVAIALKDNQVHPWPKGCCGLLYCTLLFQVCVCTCPCGGITGDCPCINHNHQCLINNVCVLLLSLFKRSSREVVVLLPAQLLTCCATSGRLLHQKKGWGRDCYFPSSSSTIWMY